MLTLLKPWRRWKDLRNVDESWDEAFVGHKFTDEQKKLLANFNLRYECLDDRDDYHRQMQKRLREAKQFTVGLWDNNSGFEDWDEDDYTRFIELENKLAMDIAEDKLGSKFKNKQKQMHEAQELMKRVGWTKRIIAETANGVSSIKERISTGFTANSWRESVKSAKERLLRERRKYLGSNINETKENKDNDENVADKKGEQVKLLNINWFQKDYKAQKEEEQDIIDTTVKEFSLNEEQERAFRIIANHSTKSGEEQLRMYLGGMGGTGKSQVIKAVISMFNKRNQGHRFIVLAPTGTAAALLNGSTYHSMLGIRMADAENEIVKSDSRTVQEVRSRLLGVQYIFIDEVSMIACHELYTISKRLAHITNKPDLPFGGMNMIFAGDFAQLPPTKGMSLYSNAMEKVQDARMTRRQQETTLGKILWHQVTTVVILRQNMRQKSQTEEDGKLRKALENMRFAACTAEDIEFLRTRIVGDRPGRPKLTDKEFHNVSIITAWNSQKDALNEMGTARFAEETGQEIRYFYCQDSVGADSNTGPVEKLERGRMPISIESAVGHKHESVSASKPLGDGELSRLYQVQP
ncbi:hypothetical protein CC1G_09386 [Coprinopsis cinerea okayama7|uniref:ATP-dependent DNA helicase n=1 Tax=Coprinopsis cinerea (strain Okayama-7 / 130 / ATCC MYA-4618 / FGSC 9003) TaxID=240176 RepID=A8NB26_COPC7|nr:hypothetical protein CC1G_09386 [Coprinopsis cinerea okayama7\|eukprot:XP_001832028.2 hypothetical protein CC1G_09386 [Coprinopsis cinerea okayama7\